MPIISRVGPRLWVCRSAVVAVLALLAVTRSFAEGGRRAALVMVVKGGSASAIGQGMVLAAVNVGLVEGVDDDVVVPVGRCVVVACEVGGQGRGVVVSTEREVGGPQLEHRQAELSAGGV